MSRFSPIEGVVTSITPLQSGKTTSYFNILVYLKNQNKEKNKRGRSKREKKRNQKNQGNQGNCVWRKSLGKDPERGWKMRRIKGAKQP